MTFLNYWGEKELSSQDQQNREKRAKTEKINCIEYDNEKLFCRIHGSTDDIYYVTPRNCTCVDFERREKPCKHMYYLNNRLIEDGITVPSSVFPEKYIVVDTETTGIDNSVNSIIEIAALKVENNVVVDTFHSYIYRDRVPTEASRVNGITADTLADAPKEADVIKAYHDFSGDLPLVGHNILFDLQFIRRAIQNNMDIPYSVTTFDTLEIARAALDSPSKRLGDVADRLGIEHPDDHSALGDAKTTFAVFLALGGKFADVRRFWTEYKDYFTPRSASNFERTEIPVPEFKIPVYPTSEEKAEETKELKAEQKKQLDIDLIGIIVSAVLCFVFAGSAKNDNSVMLALFTAALIALIVFIVRFRKKRKTSGKKK